MTGRPSKSLADRVAERQFEARRHRRLLDGPLLAGPPDLRGLQERYQRERGDETLRRALAREFERQVESAPAPTVLERARELGFEGFTRELLGFRLAGFQVDFERRFSSVDEQGLRLYKAGILGLPRGSGKTMLSAARALFELLTRPDMITVGLFAGDKAQADLGYQYIRRWLRASPELRSVVEPTADELRVPETGSTLRVLSARAAAAYGQTPDVVLADEVHVWRRADHLELWEAITSALIKRPNSWLLAITTAPSGTDSLLAGILDRELSKPIAEQPAPCLTVVPDVESGTLTVWYGAGADDDIDDERVWRACNPGPWISTRDLRLARLAPGKSDEAFAKLHLNRPSLAPEDALINRDNWERCEDALVVPPDGARVVVGVERAFGGGSAALAWLWQAPDGRSVARACVFATNSEACAAHVRGPSWRRLVDMGAVQDELAKLDARFDVVGVGLDEREVRLEHPRAQPVPSGQTKQREASRRLFQLINDAELAHDGDPVLADHVLATRGVWDTHERLNVYRREQGRSIAAWYALANALALMGPGSVYEGRGVLFLDWIGGGDARHVVDGVGVTPY